MATLNWSGRSWTIADDSNYGGHPGFHWNPNTTVDANGYLHLNLEKVNGAWYASMIWDNNPTGYGVYEFVMQGIHALDPNAVLGLFTYAPSGTQEIDFEQALWGATSGNTWDIAIHGPSTKVVPFSVPMPNNNDVYCVFEWTPTGESFLMQDATGEILYGTIPPTTIPIAVSATSPDPVKTFINLYPRSNFNLGVSYPPASNQSYVIKSFTFSPTGAQDTTLAAALSSNSINLGDPVTITGGLTSGNTALVGGSIYFVASNGDAIPSVVTDANGRFSASYKPTKSGTFTVTAHFAGTV
jgi:hypothetical protein